MTKTLTEQWCEGTLENGFYYVMSGWSTSVEIRYLGEGFFEGIKVIAPVPSYDEYKQLVSKTEQLEKKLEIAKKVLKEYGRCENGSYANKALSLIKEVK